MTSSQILTVAEMRRAEQAVFDSGVAEYALMEQAGAAAADIIWRAGAKRDALVLCGPGNNGGDGFVISRLLRERGVPVRVAVLGDSMTASSKAARDAWGGPVEDIAHATPASQVIDALFGIGLSRGLDGPLADQLVRLVDSAPHSCAIDVPSGIDSDTGACLSPVPRFKLCIALGALKPAHLLFPSAGRFAQLYYADIGLVADRDAARMLEAPSLWPPPDNAHKYTRGLVAVLGGEMSGAAALSAYAAAASGAGYVRLVGGRDDCILPHAIVRSNAEVASAFADRRVSAVLAGPGLGRDGDARTRLLAALAPGHPAVVDADALGHVRDIGFAALPSATILTPHEGEFQTLFGAIEGNRIDQARTAAKQSGAVVVLKGPHTVIASPAGRIVIAPRASSWLSTAGTGDVLAGICVARLAASGDPFQAACEGVWLHADAARRAGAAFIADDLIPCLPAAIASRLHKDMF
jgi:hydroxyethylthiazole kinase-like uncharacterized protein yjeF